MSDTPASSSSVAPLRVVLLSAFTAPLQAVLGSSILYMAHANGLLDTRVIDLREHGIGVRRALDDRPFGGGAGMVFRPEPLYAALLAARQHLQPGLTAEQFQAMYWDKTEPRPADDALVWLAAAAGQPFTQPFAEGIVDEVRARGLIIICGHYEGIDSRITARLVDASISTGPYVLSGGELPALVMVDALARLVPGVLGNEHSAAEESFSSLLDGGVEYPHYTRPEVFMGESVPPVLLSGHHGEIAKWRKEQTKPSPWGDIG